MLQKCHNPRLALSVLTLALAVALPAVVRAGDVGTSAAAATSSTAATAAVVAAPPSDISVELNKIEPSEAGCRMFMVIDNRAETALSSFKLDLVLFQTDGVIGKRLALDLAPVKASKRTVKAFDIDKMKCDAIGSILVNEVSDCRADTGPADNCLGRLSLKSLSAVQLTK